MVRIRTIVDKSSSVFFSTYFKPGVRPLGSIHVQLTDTRKR